MDYLAIVQVLAPVLGGFLGVGGIGAYFAYRSAKPKTEAEAKKLNAEVVVTFADGWKLYSEKLEKRLEMTEIKLSEVATAQEAQEAKYREIIRIKDDEIGELRETNRVLKENNMVLEGRLDALETELRLYKTSDGKQADTRQQLHSDVNKAMDNLKK